jgi:aminocarboxymuconate-semialdehyde decarboxylase
LKIVDVHNHFYPEALLREIEKDSRSASLSTTPDGERRIHYAGDYSVLSEAHFNPSRRIADMDRAGVDMQVLSLTVPGVHGEAADRGIALAKITNNAFATVWSDHPTRFRAFATLPTQAPEDAARELQRSVEDLGLVGAMVFTNLNGIPLDDERFYPIYEVAEALNVPLLIHPIAPPSIDNLSDDLRLVAVLGFPMEMTVAATRLILAGTLDRFPDLTFIMGQLAGALPMLAERVERGIEIYPELADRLEHPLDYYLRRFYYDTVPYGKIGTPLTYRIAGADRILVASDHPHQIGSLDRCADVINGMDISEDEKAMMLGGNARSLFGIRP